MLNISYLGVLRLHLYSVLRTEDVVERKLLRRGRWVLKPRCKNSEIVLIYG